MTSRAVLSVCVPLGLLIGMQPLHAEISVRLSVKYILQPDGTRPDPGNIGTVDGFSNEVVRANRILAGTGRGFRIQVVEYLDVQPRVPLDQPDDYWYNLDARANRATIESAALTTPEVWRWNPDAINIYVNNSSSGQCSFVGAGLSISLGNDNSLGVVLHELGHFFDLRHTHAGDPNCGDGPPFMVDDGDGLAATIPDHACLTRDGLSMTNFQGRSFVELTSEEQGQVNSSWLNVMSYHEQDRLLEDQMDIWTLHANGTRLGFCSGRTWFVAIGGNDDASGADANSPLATMSKALLKVTSPEGNGDDVILLRTGTYIVAPGNPINTACTLSATRGPVVISAH